MPSLYFPESETGSMLKQSLINVKKWVGLHLINVRKRASFLGMVLSNWD